MNQVFVMEQFFCWMINESKCWRTQGLTFAPRRLPKEAAVFTIEWLALSYPTANAALAVSMRLTSMRCRTACNRSCLAQQNNATPLRLRLPGAGEKNVDRSDPRDHQAGCLEENLGALEVELRPEDLTAIDNASSHIKLEGARYPEFHEKLVGR